MQTSDILDVSTDTLRKVNNDLNARCDALDEECELLRKRCTANDLAIFAIHEKMFPARRWWEFWK